MGPLCTTILTFKLGQVCGTGRSMEPSPHQPIPPPPQHTPPGLHGCREVHGGK
jgi:hypothetical protein